RQPGRAGRFPASADRRPVRLAAVRRALGPLDLDRRAGDRRRRAVHHAARGAARRPRAQRRRRLTPPDGWRTLRRKTSTRRRTGWPTISIFPPTITSTPT